MLKGTIKKYTPKFTGIHASEKKEIYLKLKDNKLALKFLNWCENVWVSTKDYGLIRFSPNIWTLLQWKIVEAFFDKDVEFINVLKARQLGGTTICIALNLFSAFIFPDLKGIIVGADYDQIKIPVLKMREMYQSIPRPLRLRKVNDSREMIKFSNGNYFVYFYPARKTSKIGQMGRGGSFNYAHFTEVAFMANERDIEVIESSLSNHYPYRKYIYESPLALDTPVLTTKGWKTIGTIEIGDYVFDEMGNPCKVIGKSPVFYNKKCYKIKFSNGEEIIADEDHLWEVWYRKWCNWHKEVVKTKDLIPKKHKIKLPLPLQLPNRDLPIDPYLLGVWLGDGRSDSGRICGNKEDLEEIAKMLKVKGYKIKWLKPDKNGVHYINVKGLKWKLRKLGLINNKHISIEYLLSSESQRRELLKGLMDTDGYVHPKNFQCDFTSTNLELLDDVCLLLSSLGIKYKRSKSPGANKERVFPNGRKYICSYSERINFSVNPFNPIFNLERKKRIQEQRKYKETAYTDTKTKLITIESIEEIESVPVQCIAVDSPSHLFLVGKTLIPTHNTANGYNFWFDRWEANKENPTSRNIFVGWWGREDYVLTNPKELEYYLKRPVFEWEEDKILEVKERYGVTITKEQIAWWRKQAKVKFREDEMAILSEYPFTEDDAFSCSTYDFVEDKPANWLNIHRTPPKRNYQIFWGTRWYEMEIAPSPAGALKTWKGWDEINPYATYIVGVDPAFSTEPDSCNSAFEVLECYADRIEQVAEFSINTIDLQRFALLVLYVATKYNAIINYEVQGGGQAFMPFLQNVYYLKRTIKGGNIWEEIKSAGLREYIYRRRDSLGNQGAKGVVMTWELKRRAFGNLQAYLNNEMLIIRSHSLIDEIRNISFEAGEFVQKRKRSTDRLMALLIALIAYQDVQYTLPTYEEAQKRLKKKKEDEKLEEKRRQWRDFNEHLKKIWFEDLFKASKLM